MAKGWELALQSERRCDGQGAGEKYFLCYCSPNANTALLIQNGARTVAA